MTLPLNYTRRFCTTMEIANIHVIIVHLLKIISISVFLVLIEIFNECDYDEYLVYVYVNECSFHVYEYDYDLP